jgi:hypothetical protein
MKMASLLLLLVSMGLGYGIGASSSGGVPEPPAPCCKRHGGFCGCGSDNTAKCCDGSLSPNPTCECG